MSEWLAERWVVLVIGFLFIGILLDAVVASREALTGFINSIRRKRAARKAGAKLP